MKKHSAFTLIEVLTTLILSGVVLALCVNIVLKATNNNERKVAYHKAVNTLNGALNEYFDKVTSDYQQICEGNRIGLLESCLDSSGNPKDGTISKTGSSYKEPVLIGKGDLTTNTALMENIFKPYLSLASFTLESGSPSMAGCSSGASYFYTYDGMRYCFDYAKSSASYDLYGDYTYGVIWVDVNGDSKPNRASSSPGEVGDTFPIIIMKDRFIPGHPTNYEASRIAQAIYFAKDEK